MIDCLRKQYSNECPYEPGPGEESCCPYCLWNDKSEYHSDQVKFIGKRKFNEMLNHLFKIEEYDKKHGNK